MSLLMNPDKREAAYIEVVEANADGTYSETGSKKFEVMFNPSAYSISYANEICNEYSVILPASNAGQLYYMYSTPQLQTFKTSLFFDTYEQYSLNTGASVLNQLAVVNQFTNTLTVKSDLDVRKKIANIAEILNVSNASATVKRVRFKWGSFSFVGAVKSAELTFVMFYANGTPARAKLDIEMIGLQESIKEYGTDMTAVYAESQLTALGKLAMVTAATGLALASTAPRLDNAIKNNNNTKEKENSQEKIEEKEKEVEDKKEKIDQDKAQQQNAQHQEDAQGNMEAAQSETPDSRTDVGQEAEEAVGSPSLRSGDGLLDEEQDSRTQEENTSPQEDETSTALDDNSSETPQESALDAAADEEQSPEEIYPTSNQEPTEESNAQAQEIPREEVVETEPSSGTGEEADSARRQGAGQNEPEESDATPPADISPDTVQADSNGPAEAASQEETTQEPGGADTAQDLPGKKTEGEQNMGSSELPQSGEEGEGGTHLENEGNVEAGEQSPGEQEMLDTGGVRMDEKPHFGKKLGAAEDDFDTSDFPAFPQEAEEDASDALAEESGQADSMTGAAAGASSFGGDVSKQEENTSDAQSQSSENSGGDASENIGNEDGEAGQVENDPYALP